LFDLEASASVPLVHWTRGGIALAVAMTIALPATAAAKTRTLTLRYGPVDMAGYETRTDTNNAAAPRLDGFITRMHAHLVDAAGRPVPQQRVMLHHVFFTNQSRGGHGDCRPARTETFYGTGEEDQEIRMPPGYGYRIHRADRWKVGWMFMNHRHTRDRVYLQYTVTVTTDRTTAPVTPYWISVSCAQNKIYSVPGDAKPATDTKTRTWVVPRNGRIVAAGAHAHGGALRIGVTSRRCGELLSSDARYGTPDDPIYNLSPILHEPAPRSMSVLTSAQGWPVRRGERLRVTSTYSNAAPHSAVMGIMHLYIAPGRARPCRPTDVQTHRQDFPGAPGGAIPPHVTPQLSKLGDDGVAHPITGPLDGPLRTLAGNATVAVRNAAFTPRRLSVPSGASVRWRFGDAIRHDVTLAGGPRAFASAYLTRGRTFRKRLTAPGEYRVFCSLHPVTMSQTIEVRPAG
jgi:plastocyanin